MLCPTTPFYFIVLTAPSPLSPSVLLVEDSATQARVLHSCIEQMGLRVLGPASTATEALQLCQAELPAVAVIDVSLADATDGVELASQLLQLGPVSIIFASAIDDLATLTRLQELRPLAILPKPYSVTSLRRVVELGLYGSMHTPLTWESPEEAQEVVLPAQKPWLFVRERGLLVRVNTDEILCVQMEQKHCILTLLSSRRHLVRIPLVQMLQHLGTAHFTQVHRSWVVQLKRIEAVDLTAGIIRLSAEAQAPLGRAYREKLLEQLQLLD